MSNPNDLRATVNVTLAARVSANLDSNATITTEVTNVTVAGVKAGQFYLVAFKDADLNAGLLMQGVVYCETDGILIIRTVNPTIAAIDPAAANLYVLGL
jgi:hypothetical protein